VLHGLHGHLLTICLYQVDAAAGPNVRPSG
jgi:hypothetical protein